MRLSKIINKLMSKLDISQADLAKKLDVSQSTISFWLNGKLHISHKNYLKLTKFCEKNGVDDKVESRF